MKFDVPRFLMIGLKFVRLFIQFFLGCFGIFVHKLKLYIIHKKVKFKIQQMDLKFKHKI